MYVIGITGLSCSGKTELSKNLEKSLGKECLLLSMDDYYKELTEYQAAHLYDDEAIINFDEPNAINFDLFISHLKELLAGRSITIPKYDLGSCVVTKHLNIDPKDYKYIVIEGVFIFCNDVLRELCDLKIWVETSEYVCALRRFIKYTRDISGYTPEFIYKQCIKFVIPGQEKYIKPTKSGCDLIYNGEKNDKCYIDMIVFLINENKEKAVDTNKQKIGLQ